MGAESSASQQNGGFGVEEAWVSIWLHLFLLSLCVAESHLVSLRLSFSMWEVGSHTFPAHLSEAV